MRSDGVRRISVKALTRVEGEGSLHVRVADGRVEIAEFSIFEPPGSLKSSCRAARFMSCPISWPESVASALWLTR